MKNKNDVNNYVYKKLIEKGILAWTQKDGDHIPKIDEELMQLYYSKYFDKNENNKILEIGCGCGDFSIFLKKSSDYKKITGVDISENAIGIAKQNAKENKINNEFKVLDITSKTEVERYLSSSSYNTVIDAFCLHCITDLEKRENFLKNMYDLMEENGIAFINTMLAPVNVKEETAWEDMRYTSEDRLHWAKVSKDIAGNYSKNKKINGDYFVPFRYFATKEEIINLVRKIGFTILEYRMEFPPIYKSSHLLT